MDLSTCNRQTGPFLLDASREKGTARLSNWLVGSLRTRLVCLFCAQFTPCPMAARPAVALQKSCEDTQEIETPGLVIPPSRQGSLVVHALCVL